jgi:AraC-like DNA-binding protein
MALAPDIPARIALATCPGLFRQEFLGTEPALTLGNLFNDLRRLNRGDLIAVHPERHLQGTRLLVDRRRGDGMWEFYRLDQDLYVVAVDGVYDVPHVETAPGEGFVEFAIRLSGVLDLRIPNSGDLRIVSPRLLVWFQPPGVTVVETLKAHVRDSGISLYCKPAFLAKLARRSGVSHWPLLEEIRNHPKDALFLRQYSLSPTLMYVGKSLLQSPYRESLRLLHAEAKALELLCEVLSHVETVPVDPSTPNCDDECDTRQLDDARNLLKTQLRTPPRVSDIARSIGMSESKLKRRFKARFGTTVFAFGLECRMRHALELLRCGRTPVGQVAYEVGYHHQTSFTAAFSQFFGFLPNKARRDMR